MVSEDSTLVSTKIYASNDKQQFDDGHKVWLSSAGISDMLSKIPYQDKVEFVVEDDSAKIVHDLLSEICDSAFQSVDTPVVKHRDKMLASERIHRKLNRTISIVDDPEDESFFETSHIVECRNNHLNRRRSISMCAVNQIIADENDNFAPPQFIPKELPKRKKKLSFSSLFGIKDKKKDKIDEEQEMYDNFDSHQQAPIFRSNTLGGRTKFASTSELYKPQVTSGVKLERTNSFIKKLEDSTNFLRRSISFRDSRKKDKEAKKLSSEVKEQQWRDSMQSLAEIVPNISNSDLSFVNYDVMNDIGYDTEDEVVEMRPRAMTSGYVARTQSMSEKRSPEFRRPPFKRLSSAFESSTPVKDAPLDTGLCEPFSSLSCDPAGAVSLPSLHHFHQDPSENGSSSPTHRYRRRPQSISSEDGGSRTRPRGSDGSFRSAGSGCSKLKRHNATRQKTRDPNLLIENRHNPDRTVRSRSLNHLDTLEMRQGVASTTDPALKDSRSEPDCTRPLLAPPGPPPEVVTSPTATPEVMPARKHMLSRSQKSSSECFSVNFEVGDEATWDNVLFFPAERGVTLHDSLAKMCEIRNIDLASCEARLQDKENSMETVLLFTQDTASLVGRNVKIVAAKDTSSGGKKLSSSFYGNHHSRKQSGSYRPRASSYFSSSTEEASAVVSSTLSLHESENKKQIKQRLTAFFGNSKDKDYEVLIDQLNQYSSKQGIPNNLNYRQGQCESVDALYNLEDDWKDIIQASGLSERHQQQQTALWELIKTEVAYIKTLKVVTDLFLACLKDLQMRNLLKEIDTEKLFSNITDILGANVDFWRNTLFPMVKYMREHGQSACIENMLEGFSKIQETFQPYDKYCAEQSRCQNYCRDNLENSDVFAAYLTWCESQKDCNRLRLMDILVQPMQRLTKYGLLLKAILRNTDCDVERDSLQAMIKMVDEFVNKVNLSLKHRQDNERLKGIIARIESYDIVESKDDDIERLLKKEKSFTQQLDLTRPMLNCPWERKRYLLLEGDLKLKDSGASKMEVHCFLLTDMLLICKPSTKKGVATMRVVRQPYLVDRLFVSELHRETPSLAVIYKNEFDMAVAAFILQSNDAKKLKGWKDGIAKAQHLYAQAKHSNEQQQQRVAADDSLDVEYCTDFRNFEYCLESDYPSLQLLPRSPLATSSRASRVSSLAHSHSGSVEMNDQSSIGSAKDQSRGVSMENDNRTGSISSDEGVQPLPPDKSPVSQKNSFKNRLFNKTPNTLSVQPYGSLGQSLPNLTLGSPNVGSMSLSLNQNTLSVPNSKNSGHLLSPTHRGISYPPPSPTRGNLRRSLAIQQNKNPPLIKTRQVNSTSSVSQHYDIDVPVIAGVSNSLEDHCESFSRGNHRQAMKRSYRYHTAGHVDDLKKNDNRDASIHKRLSWNCTSQEPRPPTEDQT